jgi:hypothetical protein
MEVEVMQWPVLVRAITVRIEGDVSMEVEVMQWPVLVCAIAVRMEGGCQHGGGGDAMACVGACHNSANGSAMSTPK